jgi:hypothetical protein
MKEHAGSRCWVYLLFLIKGGLGLPSSLLLAPPPPPLLLQKCAPHPQLQQVDDGKRDGKAQQAAQCGGNC